ncbi:MAG: transposase [Kiritimatiellia bacterium]
MPNASRYLEPGYTYHLTHRCHDRRFLLRFAQDRDAYRQWLREGVGRYGVAVYNYCVTMNHVHVIAHVEDAEAVAAMMQLASATVARRWNRRKGHEGSVWEHPYKCTRIQDGRHLLRCLRYVSLNMVRAGAVGHPDEWRWCGHDELTGRRSRYRILSIDRLLRSLEMPSVESMRAIYHAGIDEMIARREVAREAAWTEALAVGDRLFVEQTAAQMSNRSQFEYQPVGTSGAWTVRESAETYKPFSSP